ncbi:MAG TPA: hypothetical protein VH333_01620 [Pseudonocardiaceae bacterium]|jgi:hypothetical protein|nr:hypothetical protein [Pseudonocardiaceae bacterium]
MKDRDERANPNNKDQTMTRSWTTPQSGERFRGRSTIRAQRGGHPAERHFTVSRIQGGGDLWISECVITYDGVPTNSVSIMEFADGLVTHETQYLADPFQAPASRAALAEPIPRS